MGEKGNDIETIQFGRGDNGSGLEEYDDSESFGDCAKFDCPNPPCQIFCELDHGYYPDSRDCRNFCFCSGNVHVPSKFQRCAGGLVWDPSCGAGGHRLGKYIPVLVHVLSYLSVLLYLKIDLKYKS